MNNTNNPIEKSDAQIAEEITEALSNEGTQASADQNETPASVNESPASEQPAGIDLDALARILREAEERGYQRAVNEREQALNAARNRTFAMPASDPAAPTTTPTILAGLKPGFWEK